MQMWRSRITSAPQLGVQHVARAVMVHVKGVAQDARLLPDCVRLCYEVRSELCFALVAACIAGSFR